MYLIRYKSSWTSTRGAGRRKLVIFNKQTGIIAEGRKQRSLLVTTFQRQAAGLVLSSKESRELGLGPSAEASQTAKSMRLEARETESRKLQSAFDIIFSVLESLLLALKQVPAAWACDPGLRQAALFINLMGLADSRWNIELLVNILIHSACLHAAAISMQWSRLFSSAASCQSPQNSNDPTSCTWDISTLVHFTSPYKLFETDRCPSILENAQTQ